MFTCCSAGELQCESDPRPGLDHTDFGRPCALVRSRTWHCSPRGHREAAWSTKRSAYFRVALQASFNMNATRDSASTRTTAVSHARSCVCAHAHHAITEAAWSIERSACSRVALQASYNMQATHDTSSTTPTSVGHARSRTCSTRAQHAVQRRLLSPSKPQPTPGCFAGELQHERDP